MAKLKSPHTFTIYNDFKRVLDEVIAELPTAIQLDSNAITYDSIRLAYQTEMDELDNHSSIEVFSYLNDLVRQITYSNVLCKTPLEPYFSLAHTLRDALKDNRKVERFNSKSLRWRNTFKMAYLYSLRANYLKTSTNAKHVTYAIAVGYFNARNINICIDELDIKFPFPGVKLAVAETVNIPLRSLGGFGGMQLIDQLLLEHFDGRINRLRLHPNPDMMGRKIDRQIPHGLLYRLALKNLQLKSKPITPKSYSLTAITSATHMAALHDVEPFSIYETMFPPLPNEIIDYLSLVTTYDELFLIPQCHPEAIHKLLVSLRKMICSQEATKKLGWSIEDAIKFWVLLNKTSIHSVKSTFVSRADFHKQLSNIVGATTATALLRSFVLDKINVGYNYPTDASRANTRDCCIALAYGDKYWIPGSLIFAPAFMSRLISMRSDHSESFNTVFGLAFEKYLIDRLQGIGIVCKSGIVKGRSKSETAGDIDLLIETDDTIALFELKKKTLCRASTAGSGLQLLIDLSHGLIHGAAQISKHEIALIRDSRLVFRDGTTVELNGRRIFKFVVSLGDYGSLHDSTITNHIFESLAGSTFTIKAELTNKQNKDVELARKYCAELSERYFQFREVTKNPKAELFYNLSFLNIFHLEYCLSQANSAQSFLSVLLRGSRTTFGMRDRIVESALLDPNLN